MSSHAMLGSPDDQKFRSCLTLFVSVVAQRAPAADHLSARNVSRPEAGAFALTTSGLPPSARAVAAPDDSLWQDALDQFYAGEAAPATLRLLAG